MQAARYSVYSILVVALLSLPTVASDATVPAMGFAEPSGEDDELPVLVIDDVLVDEDKGEAKFTVYRIGKTDEEVEFTITTSGIEAIEDVDYIGQTTTLSIKSKKDTRKVEFTVDIIDDVIAESTETFAVTLSDPVGATLQKAEGIGAITDDDTAGIAIDSGDGVFVIEGEPAVDSIEVVLQSEPTDDVVITVTAPPNQLDFNPAVVSFEADNWYVPVKIAVGAVSDGMDEDDPHYVPITLAVDSADQIYNAMTIAPITATIRDEDALVVSIDGPTAGATGISSDFVAVVNAGGTGTIAYEWAVFLEGNQIATGNEATFSFTPDEPAPHIVRAVVGDDQGQNPAEFIELSVLSDISGSTFVHDIIWLASAGITRGCDPNGIEFCPDNTVSRGQMAAFLVRFLSLTDTGGGNTFTDDDGSIFEDDIAKLATAGITTGCNPPENTRFCPGDPVTREQMAAFLVRSLQLTDDGGGNTFTDDDGSPFEADIAKLAAAGITGGCNPDGTAFCPRVHVTRGQMAAFLHRSAGSLNN
jgi:hypothetical protein